MPLPAPRVRCRLQRLQSGNPTVRLAFRVYRRARAAYVLGREAIGVSRYRGNWIGGWSQSGRTRELHYLDPSIGPSDGAWVLLGLAGGGAVHRRPDGAGALRAPRHADEPGEA